MNRFVRGAAAAALVAGGLGSAGCAGTGGSVGGTAPEKTVARGAAPDGCAACGDGGVVQAGGTKHGDGAILRGYYDPCWPERYNRTARAEVLAPFAAQVNNGHVYNQTIWNWYFDAGKDTLNTAGLAKLDSIAQTRPGPDHRLYLQAARDVRATADNVDQVGGMRDDLTSRRAAAVQRYMASQPVIGMPVAYEVFVHDPVVPGIPAEFAASSYRSQGQGYRGGIGGAAGTTALSTGGGGQTPPASAVGGGPAGGPNTGPSSPGPNPSAGSGSTGPSTGP